MELDAVFFFLFLFFFSFWFFGSYDKWCIWLWKVPLYRVCGSCAWGGLLVKVWRPRGLCVYLYGDFFLFLLGWLFGEGGHGCLVFWLRRFAC